ncbi:hypothetical protein SDRG_11373 [Saprolegnia diclina VS20]|uniref:Uncharacterized protein n=1 Tax=Saprolegnia diclina (strain VS20) TaxID=1156394 RepID=T0RLM2_SAPDV|nr:hypothetical protein SDRG_11373 [Saprolegnia diclina VS20]EQC30892.1 hypothetical protein SDRG_11373 [Saprolegnia diclina VS20]|eukprot:XP_008615630.1 hypothetical protein SDRG_11373 [Saprolegnia diclina VS20]
MMATLPGPMLLTRCTASIADRSTPACSDVGLSRRAVPRRVKRPVTAFRVTPSVDRLVATLPLVELARYNQSARPPVPMLQWSVAVVVVVCHLIASVGAVACDVVCASVPLNASCASCQPCAIASDAANGSWSCQRLLPPECQPQRTARVVCDVIVADAAPSNSGDEALHTSPAFPPQVLFFIVAGTLGTFMGLITLHYRRKYYPRKSQRPRPPPIETPVRSPHERKPEPIALDMTSTPKYIPTFSILQDEQDEVAGPWAHHHVSATHGPNGVWSSSSVDTISSVNNDPWLFLRTERASEMQLHRSTETGSERTPSTNLANSYVDRMVSPLNVKPRSKDSFYI